MKNLFSFAILVHIGCVCGFAQIGVGTNNPDSSTVLDVQSTTRGMRLPLMTSDQRKAVGSPAIGLLVYDTDQRRLFIFDGTQWLPVNMSSSGEITPGGSVAPLNGQAESFGWAVDISGNFAIAGAPIANGKVNGAGAVYIYRNINGLWTPPTRLIANDGETNDLFGSAVAIDSPFAIVGAYAKTFERGAAYIFTFNGSSWGTTPTKIVSPDGNAGDSLGFAVDISSNGGNRAIIGAPRHGLSPTGAAYIFNGSGGVWTLEQKLTMSSPQAGDQFGAAVSIDGNTAIVGSPYDDFRNDAFSPLFVDQGSASVFARDGSWSETNKISVSLSQSGQGNAHFGSSIALKAGKFVVGAPHYGTPGHAFIYNSSGALVAQCFPPPITYAAGFGESVSITDEYILVGCPNFKGSIYYSSTGAVFSYNGNGSRIAVIQNPDPQYGLFGYSVGISGKNYVVVSPVNGRIYFGSL